LPIDRSRPLQRFSRQIRCPTELQKTELQKTCDISTSRMPVSRMTDLWSIQMASDIFAKIRGIKGESLDSKHKRRTSRSVHGPSPGGHIMTRHFKKRPVVAAQARRTIPRSFRCSRCYRQAVSELAERSCARRSHLKEATITTPAKAEKGQQEYLIIKIGKDVIIHRRFHLSDSKRRRRGRE